MKRSVLCILVLTLVFAGSATLASAQTPPVFQLGFKALADQLPAEVVGVPLENEYFNLSNGNSEQHTTKGLMVWRKIDNWTAYTNGYMTWINGPNGVQSRLNTDRFPWEKDPVVSGPAPAPAPPSPAPAPAPPAATATTNTAGSSKDACLACHGPFDKLVTASANYVWPNGDKQSPHRYVPHASTNAKDIPECTNCHKPHPVPPTASDIAAMAKPDPSWCFGCHHTGTLQCGTCHAIP